MAQLIYPSPTEVQLRLSAQENAILTVIRGWSSWIRADIEGSLPGNAQVTAVTLTAARSEDRMIRDILHRSFQLIFPAEGGEGVATALAPTRQPRRPYR